MVNGKIWHRIMFVVVIAVFAALSVYYLTEEKSYCMGVPILSEKETAEYTNYVRSDIHDSILFMGEPAAADTETDTIYISQNLDEKTLYTEVEGLLTVKDEEYSLFFAADDAFDDFVESVSDGHHFALIADMPDGSYMKYDVVFTNLPVINLNGEFSHKNEDKTSVYRGDATVWDPCYKTTGKYSVKTSALTWNRRGASTMGDKKPSWKLAFKKDDGTNNDLEFLGLEEGDDDWILNAIHRDDTKVREKVTIDIWNGYMADEPHNYPMSTGRYTEVIINGEYHGMYLLMRRIDGKYLQLNDSQTLLKGLKVKTDVVEESFEVIYSEYEGDNLWNVMKGIKTREDGSYINLDSWMDVSLLIDMGNMSDNSGSKNIYYIVDGIDTNPDIKMLLWDTDFSYGISYGTFFIHEPEGATEKRRYRKEDESLEVMYPQLHQLMAARWFELREDAFNQKTIFDLIEKNYSEITAFGAFDRELDRWGHYYDDETDTVDALYTYVEQRLPFLDECHSQNLQ